MASVEINSIGVFIDGGYYTEINKGLAPHARVDLRKLMNFIRSEIAREYNLELDSCLVTDCHYFQGRFRARDAKAKNKLESDRKFEDSLIENDVVFHYKHIHELQDGSIKEKGIDVWFALETYELAMYRDFDFVVLITGDADHEMLSRKIKALKKQVVLLTWNFSRNDSTSPALRAEVTYHIDINKLISQDPQVKNRITNNL